MRYFTSDLIERVGSEDDEVADAADGEWDAVLEKYETRLNEQLTHEPDHIREYCDLLLHDAFVLSISRRGDRLTIVAHKDIPPQDVVAMTYTLTEDPWIDPEALPLDHRCPVMYYLYDEFDVLKQDGQTIYEDSILFSNGWEMRLRFRDVRVELSDPVFTAIPTGPVAAPRPLSQSA